MKNIADLRAVLFAQLSELEDQTKPVDFPRVRAMVALSEQIIDSARLEVQLAAVLKGGMDVPFIDAQDPDHPANKPERPAMTAADPMTRAAQLLTAGPSPEHPWRQRDKRRA